MYVSHKNFYAIAYNRSQDLHTAENSGKNVTTAPPGKVDFSVEIHTVTTFSSLINHILYHCFGYRKPWLLQRFWITKKKYPSSESAKSYPSIHYFLQATFCMLGKNSKNQTKNFSMMTIFYIRWNEIVWNKFEQLLYMLVMSNMLMQMQIISYIKASFKNIYSIKQKLFSNFLFSNHL